MHPVKRARSRQDLTQEELADALGVHRQTVADWESGTVPRPENQVRLADFLDDLSRDELTPEKGTA